MASSRSFADSAAFALSIVAPDNPLDDTVFWKVYLMECADGSYYCGVAKFLERRLRQHNGLQAGGAKYTRSRRPVKLLAFRSCPDKKSAYSLEYAVKAAPRGKKQDVLLNRNLSDVI